MSHLIRGFDVNIGKIITVPDQRVKCRLRFSFIIGIKAAVRALHPGHIHPRSHGNPFQEINGGNHDALLSRLFIKGRKGRAGSRAPEPAAVGRIQALLSAFHIDGMIFQNFIASDHHLVEIFVIGKIGADFPAEHIVGRGKLFHLSVLPDQAVPVAGSHIKMIGRPVQLFHHGAEKNGTVLCFDLSGAVVQDSAFCKRNPFLFRKGHDVAPQSDIRILHGDPDAQGLQR